MAHVSLRGGYYRGLNSWWRARQSPCGCAGFQASSHGFFRVSSLFRVFPPLRMHLHRTAAAGRGGGGRIVSSFSHAASRVRLILAQLQHSMTLSWLALTLSAVIILRLSGVLLLAELQGLSTLFVEELESFFVVPWSEPSLYFAVVPFIGLGSRVLKFSFSIEFRSCSKSIRAT